ncbi:hypothetical protein ACHAXN_010909 [Cyclotella atomus]
MQKLATSFAFVFMALTSQLACTNAGIASIIARAHIGHAGSVQTIITSDRDELNEDTNLNSRTLKAVLDEHIQESTVTQEEEVTNIVDNDRRLDHEFNDEPNPKYKSYQQPKSKMTRGQKIGLVSMLGLTIALAIYSCVLRYELSTLNVYSLLGVYTSTQEDEEEKVGDAYGSRVEMI